MRKIVLVVASMDISRDQMENLIGATDQDYGMSAFFKHDSTFMAAKHELVLAMENEAPPGFPKFKNMFSNALIVKKEQCL